ncbi:MAG: MOSC N-terminal beta barrel domain-containing protein [Propionibacteriaceae bacterium]|nr:MOSC N-terminal beta barrel domain-containing protein [Propionibacteriaceae bacterium]
MSIPAFQVQSFGYAPIKGTRHEPRPVDVDRLGPVGDRRWCLVDDQCRVLKTVQHPQLLAVRATWNETLNVEIPGAGEVSATPAPSGERCTVDYWKRAVTACFVPSELDDAFSQYLGKSVRLVRPERGAIVYGSPISIITTASIRDLGQRVGVDGLESEAARFRATYLVNHDDAYIEDTWCGHTIRLGEVLVEVQSLIGRCAVIDANPVTGERDGRLLRELADYRPRNDAGEPCLGVQGRVVGIGKK